MTSEIIKFNFKENQNPTRALPAISQVHARFRSIFQSLLNQQLRFACELSEATSWFAPLAPSSDPNASLTFQLVDKKRSVFLTATMDTDLAKQYTNLRQGGLPQPGRHAEPLGQMGTALLQQFIQLMVSALNDAWREIANLDLANGNSIGFTSTQLDNQNHLWLNFEYALKIAGTGGKLTVSYPQAALYRLKKTTGAQKKVIDPVWYQHISQKIYNLPVELVAVVGTAELTVRDLQQLQPGDVITLDRFANDPIDIKIEGLTKLQGMPGISSGRRCVRIVR